jgi:hypothetical protein
MASIRQPSAVAALVYIHLPCNNRFETAPHAAERTAERFEMINYLSPLLRPSDVTLFETDYTVVVKHWYTPSDWIAESALLEWMRCNNNQKK